MQNIGLDDMYIREDAHILEGSVYGVTNIDSNDVFCFILGCVVNVPTNTTTGIKNNLSLKKIWSNGINPIKKLIFKGFMHFREMRPLPAKSIRRFCVIFQCIGF